MVNHSTYKRAVKAADEFIDWAIKTYPELAAEGIPRILSTYVTAAIVFKESGYTWYETSGDGAFVSRTLFTERYPMIPFIRSSYLIAKFKGALSYYAVKERFVEFIGNASYYLPTVEEIKKMVTSVGKVPHLTPLLVVPIRDYNIKKVLEVHLHGRPTEQA